MPRMPSPDNQPQSRLQPAPMKAAPASATEASAPAATGGGAYFAPMPSGAPTPDNGSSIFPNAEDIPADVNNAPENVTEPAATDTAAPATH